LPFGHCIFKVSYCILEIKIRFINTTVTEKTKIRKNLKYLYILISYFGAPHTCDMCDTVHHRDYSVAALQLGDWKVLATCSALLGMLCAHSESML
jgi:hypothetical protein